MNMRALRAFASSRLSVRRLIGPVLAIAALGLAAWLLHRQLQKYGLAEIGRALGEIGLGDMAMALAFTAGSYFCLTISETLGVRYTGRRLPYRKIAFTCFVSLSLGHNIGLAALSSGAIRYRFYSAWGFTLGDVGRIVLLSGTTIGLGYATLAGAALIARPDLATEMLGLGGGSARIVAAALLLGVAIYVLVAWRVAGAGLRLWRWRVAMPPLPIAALQVVVGAANTACVVGVLYTTLSALTEASYLAVVAVYVLAAIAAIASHVPGGLGVLEAVVMSFSPGVSTFGALVAFRVAYFLIPLGLGAVLFAAAEAWRRWGRADGPTFAVAQPRGGER
jgi:uncharacterized membrane protein YbhN (UPF0104 family)